MHAIKLDGFIQLETRLAVAGVRPGNIERGRLRICNFYTQLVQTNAVIIIDVLTLNR